MRFSEVLIGDVAKIVNGGTPDTKVATYWEGDIAWLTPKDMGKAPSPYTRQTSRTISQAGLNNCSARLVPTGSVILSTRAPIGHLAINDVEMAFNQGCRGLVPSERLNVKYLYYFLQANVGLLNDLGTGTTFKELSAGALASVRIPLPPLPEQQRIVAILDEVFEDLSCLTTKVQLCERAVLEFFSRRTGEILTGGDGWDARALGDVCTLQRGFDLPVQDRKSGSAPLISSSGPIAYQADAPVRAPGVVTGRSGSIGKVFWVSEDFWPLNTTLYVKDFHGNDPRFIFRLLQSFDLARFAGGAGVPTLNRNSVHSVVVRVPPSVCEQQHVAAQIDALEEERDQMFDLAKRKLALMAELRQSILARAFSGELTRERLAA